MAWFDRLKQGLKKTHDKITDQVSSVIGGKRRIDDELLDDLEAILIEADLGVDAAMSVIDGLKSRVKEQGAEDAEAVYDMLKAELVDLLSDYAAPLALRDDGRPTVISVLGVNGSGKTTSIAKMAQRFQAEGRVEVWSERVGAKLVKHSSGSDPGAVAYDAADYAVRNTSDVLLIDTAGRLQTKRNLMEELKKIHRVVEKRLDREIDEKLLVLDGTVGQNALQQARVFHEAVNLTGLVITKLDGTAKGGAIVPIAQELGIPIKLIGVGETSEDLQIFRAEAFVEALFS